MADSATASPDDDQLKEREFQFEKFKFRIGIWKWVWATVVLGSVTWYTDDAIKERNVGIQEMQAFDKYVEVILKADNIEQRWNLAQFFATVTPTDRLRSRWIAYRDSISPDYQAFKRLKDSLAMLLRQPGSLEVINQVNQVKRDLAPLERKLVNSVPTISQANSENTRPDQVACRPITVIDIPGYSLNNRYFSKGLNQSFILAQGGFGVYMAGGPDSYIWDSLKYCQGKYIFHYQKGLAQEPSLHGDVYAEINSHSVRLLNSMGMFGPGEYDLLFDFVANDQSGIVPLQDTGRWQFPGAGGPFQAMVVGKKEIEFGSANGSSNLQRFSIDQIRVDRFDNSELFDLTALEPGPITPGTKIQVIIKHGIKNSIILMGPPNQVVSQPINWLFKS